MLSSATWEACSSRAAYVLFSQACASCVSCTGDDQVMRCYSLVRAYVVNKTLTSPAGELLGSPSTCEALSMPLHRNMSQRHMLTHTFFRRHERIMMLT